MAFWKKSEDPWDIDPEKRKKQTTAAFWENDAPAETDPVGAASGRPEEEPRGQSLGESIKGFFGGKKEDAPITPEKCPWCGKDMEWGRIDGGRDYSVMWRNWKPRGFLGLSQPDDAREIDLLDEGDGLRCYKTIWYCQDCGKMVLDAPAYRSGPNYTWENGQVKQPQGDGQVWGANPTAYADYQSQWGGEKKEET